MICKIFASISAFYLMILIGIVAFKIGTLKFTFEENCKISITKRNHPRTDFDLDMGGTVPVLSEPGPKTAGPAHVYYEYKSNVYISLMLNFGSMIHL